MGFIGSAFAAGFVAGCLLVPRLVAQVGHVRVFGAMAAGVGLAHGAFGTLAPVDAQNIGLPVGAVALLAAGAVIGGALIQAPVGWLSDRRYARLDHARHAIPDIGRDAPGYGMPLAESAGSS
jgi:MFS family permease